MDGVTVFRRNRLAIDDKTILAIDIDLDPLSRLAHGQIGVIPLATGKVGQVLAIGGAAGWLLEDSLEASRCVRLLEEFEPLAVIVWRIGVHPDAMPSCAAITDGRVAADAALQRLDNGPRHLTRFVDPRSGEFER